MLKLSGMDVVEKKKVYSCNFFFQIKVRFNKKINMDDICVNLLKT